MLMPSIFGEDLFDDWMRPLGRDAVSRGFSGGSADLMKTDIRDIDGNYELSVDLPGFNKEDMKIQLKDGYLTLQATRTDNKDEKDANGKYVRRERYTGHCSRSFFVGRSIQQEDVHAKYENGVLKVTFPKEETKREVEEKKYICIEG
ncbi:Hsp20/alpha crystallin family protein [Ruminococcus sp. 5_1_39BFAA]|uniref:Hsp20/alpha crystallin family protein n=1 Tax=Ruminococcus sp. 5_1_39BFAA TaxID=457412 RepID=UPI003564E7C3